MGMIQTLSKLQNAMASKRVPEFEVPVKKQKAYIGHFPEPKDDFQRSYFQYRTQAMLQGRLMYSLVSVASLPLTVLMLLKFRRASAPKKEAPCDNRAVFFRDGKPANIMPNVLKEEFAECVVDPVEGNCLRKEDMKLVWELIRRYPFSWQMILKCVIKIARYRYAIEKYAPKALIVCNEYSFTSSVLTQFCQCNGVELINVMHGEKFYFVRDSFFRFHRCYVWDENYRRLLENMRAEPTQFRIAVPESLKFRQEEIPEKCYDYTYYLGYETPEALTKLPAYLRKLQAQGAAVNVRPHPRYTNMAVLAEHYQGIHIEEPSAVTIETSILQSRAAVSLASTVLLQAYYNGVPVVIDDVTDPAQFAKLREVEYALLDKEHTLLSQVLQLSDSLGNPDDVHI